MDFSYTSDDDSDACLSESLSIVVNDENDNCILNRRRRSITLSNPIALTPEPFPTKSKNKSKKHRRKRSKSMSLSKRKRGGLPSLQQSQSQIPMTNHIAEINVQTKKRKKSSHSNSVFASPLKLHSKSEIIAMYNAKDRELQTALKSVQTAQKSQTETEVKLEKLLDRHAKIKARNDELLGHMMQVDDESTAMEAMKRGKDKLLAKNERLAKKSADLTTKIRKMEQERMDSARNVADLKNQIKSAENEAQSLRDSLEKTREDLRQREHLVQRFEMEMKDMKSTLDQVQAKNERFTELNKSLSNAVVQMEEKHAFDVESLKNQHLQGEKERNRVHAELVAQYQKRVASLTAELKNEKAAALQNVTHSQRKIRSAEISLNSKETQMEHICREMGSQIKDLERENANLKAQVNHEECEERIEALQRRLSEFVKRSEFWDAKIALQKETTAWFKDQVERLDFELDTALKERNMARKELQMLENRSVCSESMVPPPFIVDDQMKSREEQLLTPVIAKLKTQKYALQNRLIEDTLRHREEMRCLDDEWRKRLSENCEKDQQQQDDDEKIVVC